MRISLKRRALMMKMKTLRRLRLILTTINRESKNPKRLSHLEVHQLKGHNRLLAISESSIKLTNKMRRSPIVVLGQQQG